MQNILANRIDKSIPPPAKQRSRPGKRTLIRRFAGVGTFIMVLAVWQLITGLGLVAPFLIPPPEAVASKFYTVLTDGRLWLHTSTTFTQVLAGLAIGLTVGTVLGYLIAKSPLLEDILSPVIVAFQSTPIVAYAPLLVIWFGSGTESKVITCALIVFFPMLMNTVVGIRNVPSDLKDLMWVSRATRWQTFTKLELPAAMPVLLTGLKTSATLAVIGAVVGEFIVARAGLGYLINVARSSFDTPLVFVAVLTLAVMASLMYACVSLLERRLLAWQRRNL